MKNLTHVAYLIIALFFISACATVLTKRGSSIQLANADDVRPYCRILHQGTFRDNANLIRNYAANIGAEYIVNGGKPNQQEVNVSMISCPDLVKMSVTEIQNKCKANDSNACIEMAYRSRGNNELIHKNLQKACSLKNNDGCQLIARIKEKDKLTRNKDQNDRRLTKAISSCDKGSSKDCLIIAAAYNQNGHHDIAIRTAERACSLGNKEGCLMQSNLLNEQQQRNQLIVQMMMLQQQNAAAVQAQQQQINSTVLQTQMLMQGINAQQPQYQQNVPTQQYKVLPSVIPKTKTCSGNIRPSGHFSATCN